MIGTKHDSGKAKAGLMMRDFAKALQKIAAVTTFGATRYAPGNWRKVEGKEERYSDAMYRHLLAHESGEEIDADSGLPHLAHAAWNVIALLELQQEREVPASFSDLLRAAGCKRLQNGYEPEDD